jgi:hypothetical protein
MDRDDFEDYRRNIDEQIQWLQANNQPEQAENLRTQLEQTENIRTQLLEQVEEWRTVIKQGQSRGM